MIVTKSVTLFSLAALINGGTWWAGFAVDEHNAGLIQTGGTVGLILCLLGGVTALWKDREQMRARFEAELLQLRQLVVQERREHREELVEMRKQHKIDITEITDRYMDELRRQVDTLRADTQTQLREKVDA
jgi:hypothetical protein